MTHGKSAVCCTACGFSQSVPVLTRDALALLRCARCDLVFLARYASSFVPELYAYYQRYLHRPKDEVFDSISAARCLDLLKQFAPLVTGRRLIDVGCGLGQFVDIANQNGWQAEGYELARRAVQFAQRHGIPVHEQDFLTVPLEKESIDVVVMSELIEHVPNPSDFLRRAEEVLRPGGLVYVTTPNFASLERRLLGCRWEVIHLEHLSYFTPRTLRALVRRCSNLEIVRLSTRHISESALKAMCLRWLPSQNREQANTCPVTSTDDSSSAQHVSVNIRHRIEASPPLRLAKFLVNGLLGATGLGASMVVLLRRPWSSPKLACGDRVASCSRLSEAS